MTTVPSGNIPLPTSASVNSTVPVPAAAVVPPAQEPAVSASFADFEKIHLRTAEIIEAKPHPNADRLVVLQLQVGERRKQIVAGIRAWYPPETLVGRTVVIVDNLEPRKLRGETSEGMLLAVRTPDGGARLIAPDAAVPSGLTVS
jgi:methionyl-tRNA synthetase